jgi:hypothetical protein
LFGTRYIAVYRHGPKDMLKPPNANRLFMDSR